MLTSKWITGMFALLIAFTGIMSITSPASAEGNRSDNITEINECGTDKTTGENGSETYNIVVPEDCTLLVQGFQVDGCDQLPGAFFALDGPLTVSYHVTDGEVYTLPTGRDATRMFLVWLDDAETNNWAMNVVLPAPSMEYNGAALPNYGPFDSIEQMVAECASSDDAEELMVLRSTEDCAYLCDLDGDGAIDEESIPQTAEEEDEINPTTDGFGNCSYFCPDVDSDGTTDTTDEVATDEVVTDENTDEVVEQDQTVEVRMVDGLPACVDDVVYTVNDGWVMSGTDGTCAFAENTPALGSTISLSDGTVLNGCIYNGGLAGTLTDGVVNPASDEVAAYPAC